MTENWKSIPGFPFYEVSDLGRVRALDRPIHPVSGGVYIKPGRIMKLGRPRNVYPIVRLDGRTHLVHRLVAKAFLPEPENESQNTVNHKDGKRDNNTPANLEWLSLGDNHRHAFSALGRKPFVYGEKATVIGGITYVSRSAAARALGVSEPAVAHALRNGGRVSGQEVSNA